MSVYASLCYVCRKESQVDLVAFRYVSTKRFKFLGPCACPYFTSFKHCYWLLALESNLNWSSDNGSKTKCLSCIWGTAWCANLNFCDLHENATNGLGCNTLFFPCPGVKGQQWETSTVALTVSSRLSSYRIRQHSSLVGRGPEVPASLFRPSVRGLDCKSPALYFLNWDGNWSSLKCSVNSYFSVSVTDNSPDGFSIGDRERERERELMEPLMLNNDHRRLAIICKTLQG
jgi:hypothetical protein